MNTYAAYHSSNEHLLKHQDSDSTHFPGLNNLIHSHVEFQQLPDVEGAGFLAARPSEISKRGNFHNFQIPLTAPQMAADPQIDLFLGLNSWQVGRLQQKLIPYIQR